MEPERLFEGRHSPNRTPDTVGTITRTFELEDSATPDSRTVVNDAGTIGYTASENMTSHIWAVVKGAKIKSANGKTATRKAGTPSTVTVTHNAVTDAALYSYVFVSPNTNGAKFDETEFDTLTVHLAESQTPTTASFDPRQDVLVSKAIEAAAPGSDNKAQLETVLFKRLFIFFRMTIDRSVVTEIPAGDRIRAVSIEALDPTVTLSGGEEHPLPRRKGHGDHRRQRRLRHRFERHGSASERRQPDFRQEMEVEQSDRHDDHPTRQQRVHQRRGRTADDLRHPKRQVRQKRRCRSRLLRLLARITAAPIQRTCPQGRFFFARTFARNILF